MKVTNNVTLLFAIVVAFGMSAYLMSPSDASGETPAGVHAVAGVRNANPTPDAPVRVTVSTPGDGMIKIEGVVVLSDSHWLCVDKPDGKTAWIPTSSVVFVEGSRTKVR